MATFYPVGGGAPGIDPSVLTATAGDVVAGMVAGVKDNYNPATGTLTLTGNAQQNHVLSGETYYTTNPKVKITGTMSIQSILSFSCAPYSANQIIFTWQNPSIGPFSGVIIIGKTGGYPANINDGTRYYKGFGSNTGAGGTSNAVVGGFSVNVTYYFRAFSYTTVNSEEWVSGNTIIANTIIQQITQVFTSSSVWYVPSGVHEIQAFTVGAGGSGGWGGDQSDSFGGGGGGGGYTTTITSSVTPGQQLNIIIGSGTLNADGSNTYISEIPSSLALGGKKGRNGYEPSGGFKGAGGEGGSGGGGSAFYYSSGDIPAGNGGTNGGDGETGGAIKGFGQNTTTCAFGEVGGTPYSGGGGGGGSGQHANSQRGYGGYYGGGNGADVFQGGSPGTANSGGGGGGGMIYNSPNTDGYAGGSGICIIRYVG